MTKQTEARDTITTRISHLALKETAPDRLLMLAKAYALVTVTDDVAALAQVVKKALDEERRP